MRFFRKKIILTKIRKSEMAKTKSSGSAKPPVCDTNCEEKQGQKNFSSTYSDPAESAKVFKPLILTQPLIELRFSEREGFTESLTYSDIQGYLKEYETYVIAQEISKENITHYHVIVHAEHEEIEIIRKRFHDQYPKAKANKYCQIKKVRDPRKYLKYCLKDQTESLETVWFKGITREALIDFYRSSYKKKDTLMEDLEKAVDKYFMSKLDSDMSDLIYDIYMIKAKYGQIVDDSWVKKYVRSRYYKKYPNAAKKDAKLLAYDIQNLADHPRYKEAIDRYAII